MGNKKKTGAWNFFNRSQTGRGCSWPTDLILQDYPTKRYEQLPNSKAIVCCPSNMYQEWKGTKWEEASLTEEKSCLFIYLENMYTGERSTAFLDQYNKY